MTKKINKKKPHRMRFARVMRLVCMCVYIFIYISSFNEKTCKPIKKIMTL